MQLYLVRHGATALNEKRVYQGWTDLPLTETGQQQCALVKEKLSGVKFDTVISSPLERAVSSAQIIAGTPRNCIITDEALKEVNFGAWEGLNSGEAEEKYPAEWQAWYRDWINYGPPQGENFTLFYRRVVVAVKQIIHYYPGKTVLLVSHEGTLRCIVSHLLDLPPEAFWRFSFEFGCYSKLEINQGSTVLKKMNC
ncbi:MAG TPA: alpha-ribazole phosphatase [Firmicutes bacterium]|jgi:alpha-ribazole phosphatase|nr:alpha-ribazole phosphatase [Bacillota bacterium]